MAEDPHAIYTRISSELEQLERDGADAREWTRFSTEILEAVMQCQSIVMERQRAILEHARDDRSDARAEELRASARDALRYVDNQTALYQRARAKR